jgi:hypothetical protein
MVRERMRVERECVREVRDVYDMSYVLVKDARLSAGDHRAELPAMRVIPHFSVIEY